MIVVDEFEVKVEEKRVAEKDNAAGKVKAGAKAGWTSRLSHSLCTLH